MDERPSKQVTQLLSRIGSGTESPATLMPLVYAELRGMAQRFMQSERDEHTLQPTALVHEAFVRMVDGESTLGRDRAEFLAVAARAMRHLLIDHARRRRAEKRGGASQDRVTLTGLDDAPKDLSGAELIDLDAALSELEELDSQQSQIVEMCYFAGMTGQEMAEKLGVHRNTVVRDLQMARAWLRQRLGSEGEG